MDNWIRTLGQVRRGLTSLLNKIRKATPIAIEAARQPGVMGYLLLTARRAQIFLVTAVLVLVFMVSPLLDLTIKSVYPEKTSKKLFGLVKQTQQDPAQKTAYDRIMFILWVLTIGETLLLVWLHIPGGYEMALSRSGRRKSIDGRNGDGELSKTTIIAAASADPGFVGPDNRYTLEKEIGRGGMGIVYRARDNVLTRQVALKKLPRSLTEDKEYLARFEREARTLARLTHPSILQVFDLFNDKGEFWMALEHIEGGDLADYLSKHGTLSPFEAAAMVRKIADGMAYAHRENIIHRDLKPGNVLLTQSADPKISDFGLAKMPVSSELTQEGTILGSPRYMSPEQAAGKDVDHRSDIYSLGIILYEMVTGETPFNGDTSQILAKHLTQTPVKPRKHSSEIPHELEELILGMLIKAPEDRIQSMAEVAAAVAALTIPTSPARIPGG